MAQLKDYKAKVNPRNKRFADKIRKLSEEYSIVGVVDVTSLPAPQFQRIRSKLYGTAKVLIVKKNLIELILTELEKKHAGISALIEKCSGVVGLVFTNDNPFTLYKFVKKNKSSAPAKSGQIAPNDIVVPAGPTNFSPGPIIGELGAFKITAGINAGKVEIKQDSIVAKEGEEISAPLAGILSRLGIEPMEVGLNIKGIYEAGTLYDKAILDVDEEAVLEDVKNAASNALALAKGMGYMTPLTVPMFIGKASSEALAVALGIDYISKDTIASLVAKAQGQMASVSSALPEDLKPAGIAAPVAAAPVEAQASASNEEQKQTEQKKETPEADAAAGLGALF